MFRIQWTMCLLSSSSPVRVIVFWRGSLSRMYIVKTQMYVYDDLIVVMFLSFEFIIFKNVRLQTPSPTNKTTPTSNNPKSPGGTSEQPSLSLN